MKGFHLYPTGYWLDYDDDGLTSWREHLTAAMALAKEDWKDVVACTLDDGGLDVRFDDSFGGTSGKPFGLWTKRRVYFPAVYDGKEWVESVPRNPSLKPIKHVGGE